MVNNILLTQNLTCVLIRNLTVRFLKYIIIFILLSKVVAYDQFCR